MRQFHIVHHVWYALVIPAMVYSLVLATTRLVHADASPVAGVQDLSEVLTLPETARFLRVSPDEIERMARQGCLPGRHLGAQWRFSRTALMAWLARTDTPSDCAVSPELASSVASPGAAQSAPQEAVSAPQAPASSYGSHMPSSSLSRHAGRGSGGTLAQATPETTPPTTTETVGEKPELGTAEDVALRGQRVLLKPRELTLELGLFYARSDRQDIQLIPAGEFVAPTLVDLEQDTFTSTYTARMGIVRNTQLFASFALLHQMSTTAVPGQRRTEESTTRTETGDITLGVRRTLFREGLHTPEVILSVEGRIPTAASSYGVGGGIALVKTFDPLVLFGNFNYLRTFSREFSDVTRLQPQDTFSTSFGYAVALNDTLSLSTSVSGLFTSETAFTNAILRARKRFSLQFGLTALLKEGLSIEPTVSFDLNGPGDNVTLGVSLPYTFGL